MFAAELLLIYVFDKNTKPRHVNIALLQNKINLARQQNRSDFNSDISLNHLANLQLKAFSVFSVISGISVCLVFWIKRRKVRELEAAALKTTEENWEEEAASRKQWLQLKRLVWMLPSR